MLQKKTSPNTKETVINRGIDVLIRELGHPDALEFILAIERGNGDSVKEFKKLWGNKTVREIHNEILAAKEKGII